MGVKIGEMLKAQTKAAEMRKFLNRIYNHGGKPEDLSGLTDDDVIEHGNPEEFSGSNKTLRDRIVLGARKRVARGMVMQHDEGRGVRDDRHLIKLPWMDERGVQGPCGHHVKAERLVLGVEQDDDNLLAVEGREVSAKRPHDSFRVGQ